MRNPPALPGDPKSSTYAGIILGVIPSTSGCVDAVFPLVADGNIQHKITLENKDSAFRRFLKPL